MKKVIRFFKTTSLLWLTTLSTYGQSNPETVGEKIKSAATNVNQQATKTAQNTKEVSDQLQVAGQQVQTTVDNIKAITRVFEPIFKLRGRNKGTDFVQGDTTLTQPQNTGIAPSLTPTNTEVPVVQTIQGQEVPIDAANTGFIPESTNYNTDGSANLGNQNHKEYGCYIDVVRGQILDDISVATETHAVDLIFTATDHFGNSPAYALLTPSYVKNDFFANYYFRGMKYKDANVPPKIWDHVNESEVALTPITGVQFEKIQNNNQLMAIVKQTQGFKDHVESRTKLTGKVFAIKTEMGNRSCYGLLYVLDHFGTIGSNGYLKIKLKVTGFDTNGDGNPDTAAYTVR